METSDKEIIAKIKKGNINYYSLIVKKHTAIIYRFIKNKISVKEDTEDLVQNSFLKLYKSIHRLDENKPILPYLYEIAKNELKMFYRSRKPTIQLNENIIGDETADKETINDNESYLKLLKKKEKEIFLLINKGFKNEEIANKFKTPLNTIKSIIRRARLRLKNFYE